MAINNDGDRKVDTDFYDLTLHNWHSFEMKQWHNKDTNKVHILILILKYLWDLIIWIQYNFESKHNGARMDDVVVNNQPKTFRNVTIFFGLSGSYPAINGRIRNFKYTAHNSTLYSE